MICVRLELKPVKTSELRVLNLWAHELENPTGQMEMDVGPPVYLHAGMM